MELSKPAYWAGHGYLARCTKRSQQLGTFLSRGAAVREIEAADDSFGFNAIVQSKREHKIAFRFKLGSWTGKCSCPDRYFCKHCYAAMLMLKSCGATMAR